MSFFGRLAGGATVTIAHRAAEVADGIRKCAETKLGPEATPETDREPSRASGRVTEVAFEQQEANGPPGARRAGHA